MGGGSWHQQHGFAIRTKSILVDSLSTLTANRWPYIVTPCQYLLTRTVIDFTVTGYHNKRHCFPSNNSFYCDDIVCRALRDLEEFPSITVNLVIGVSTKTRLARRSRRTKINHVHRLYGVSGRCFSGSVNNERIFLQTMLYIT